MTTNQIYTLVNSVTSQAIGSTALTAVDASTLVALGDTVLSSTTNTEAWLSTLLQRVGKTIFAFREYRNKLADMVVDDFTMGAILQKISFQLVDAVSDPSYSLTDGSTVDPYKIYNPEVEQKLFVQRTPYMMPITISRVLLKEAFLSEAAMQSFIGYIFGTVRNSIELSLENLGRTTINNFMAEIYGTAREIKLVTMFNTEFNRGSAEGQEPALTAATAYNDPQFLRWAVGVINIFSDYLTDMSEQFNDGTIPRHTPKDRQKFKVLSLFERKLETVVQWQAFKDGYVSLNNYETMNFWQSQESVDKIDVNKASAPSTEVKGANIVGFMYDRDALGTYQKEEDVLTTPVNAAGRYYNTFYHMKQLWFNDLSENGIIFTLN